MARNILQDIVPPERRSIRSVPVPNRRSSAPVEGNRDVIFDRRAPSPVVDQPLKPDSPKVYSYSDKPSFRERFSAKGIWVAAGLALVIVLIAVVSLSSGATLKITPITKTTQAQGIIFGAYQGSAGVGVPYEIIKISKDVGTAVNATGEEKASIKASGSIIIYNDFSSANQRLIKNTRFATPEGLVYRINDSVVVPGQVVRDGKKVPGSLEVVVYADEPGEKYNIKLSDFTIPGFKGDPRYSSIYARSKTLMTGGFVGVIKKVSNTDLTTAQSTLQAQLKDALSKEVATQVPLGYVAYEDGMITQFENLAQSDAQGSTVQVNERGTLTAIMFKKDDLSQYLGRQLFSDVGSTTLVSISDIEKLGFELQNKTSFNPSQDIVISFKINSDVTFVTLFDEDKLKQDLAGRPKGDLGSVLSDYTSIDRADAILKPFWKRSFPSNPKDIDIVIQNAN